MLENADEFFKVFQQSINDSTNNDETLLRSVKVFSKVSDRQALTHLQMITLLYHTVISQIRGMDIMARDRYGEYSLFDQAFNDASHNLKVEFPLPAFELADKGTRSSRISNLDHVLGLIGPIIPSYIKPELKLELNLIYMLLVAEHLVGLKRVDPIDLAVVNLEFLDFFDSVLELTVPKDDQALNKEWVQLKQTPAQIDWAAVLRFLLKVVLKYREVAQGGDVTESHITKLKDYIYCSDLLFECLQVAVVSDRKAIEKGVSSFPREFSSLRVST
jgi:hypothetical protein